MPVGKQETMAAILQGFLPQAGNMLFDAAEYPIVPTAHRMRAVVVVLIQYAAKGTGMPPSTSVHKSLWELHYEAGACILPAIYRLHHGFEAIFVWQDASQGAWGLG